MGAHQLMPTVEELARLIDPRVWQAREEDQKTVLAQFDFHERRRQSTAAVERVAARLAKYGKVQV